MDNELLLFDRLNIIKDTIKKYGEDNFYLSFSGGKDSTVLHYLIDMALPNNKIPRVFINTGIEYEAIVNFVKDLADHDKRFIILKPATPIIPTLQKFGYPFKSKQHSHNLELYQNHNQKKFDDIKAKIEKQPDLLNDYEFVHNLPAGTKTLVKYFYGVRERERELFTTIMTSPKCLKYQFSEQFKIKVSANCCLKMKKEPIHKWEKENGRTIALTGMRAEEGGTRQIIKGCVITDAKGKIKKFHPLLKVDDEFENWIIKEKDIKLCELYYSPFNFKRTGCVGCPFSLTLQEQLDTLEMYLPKERAKAELIWKPVYQEYRRIGYRLKDKISLFDFIERK